VLQPSVYDMLGHTAPPWAVLVTMERVLPLLPVLQVLEHSVRADHSLVTQSIAQGWVLQAMVWSNIGHATPLLAAAVVTVRLRVVVPPPHPRLQPLKSPHALMIQSMGQALVLQSAFWCCDAQTRPLCFIAVMTLRVLILMPLPHVSEQAP
jgi:hypothetical protein